ncbi:unnamed protein product [Acanthosepion pharaonis]|uniref:Uncharacterized protein n=1 Tax=Acanthosepion pharaonis TaxID=158019 RepID=A0A812BD19_ACAPH|nr:unnamed protein product [Sepia pharaonis]
MNIIFLFSFFFSLFLSFFFWSFLSLSPLSLSLSLSLSSLSLFHFYLFHSSVFLIVSTPHVFFSISCKKKKSCSLSLSLTSFFTLHYRPSHHGNHTLQLFIPPHRHHSHNISHVNLHSYYNQDASFIVPTPYFNLNLSPFFLFFFTVFFSDFLPSLFIFYFFISIFIFFFIRFLLTSFSSLRHSVRLFLLEVFHFAPSLRILQVFFYISHQAVLNDL